MTLCLIVAEFETPERLIGAVEALAAQGDGLVDAFTPFPLEALESHLAADASPLSYLTAGGGAVGAVVGYGMQWYSATLDYPINVGGRPLHSWPAFLPVTFELGILCAAFAAFLGLLALNGLPRLHHPLFDLPRFSLASRDRFFGCWRKSGRDIETRLRHLGALRVEEIIE